jgi:hypothetical protein
MKRAGALLTALLFLALPGAALAGGYYDYYDGWYDWYGYGDYYDGGYGYYDYPVVDAYYYPQPVYQTYDCGGYYSYSPCPVYQAYNYPTYYPQTYEPQYSNPNMFNSNTNLNNNININNNNNVNNNMAYAYGYTYVPWYGPTW